MFNSLVFSLCVAFFAFLMTIYPTFNTGQSENNQYKLILSLPVSRLSVINAKYLIIILWWLNAYISTTVILILLKSIVDINIPSILDIKIILLSLSLTYILTSIFYPLYFKFGFQIASTTVTVIFFILTSGLGKLLSLELKMITILIEHPIISVSFITVIFVLASYLFTAYSFIKKIL
ncbi:ABC-2 transporter permease [Paenibacillus alvei]